MSPIIMVSNNVHGLNEGHMATCMCQTKSVNAQFMYMISDAKMLLVLYTDL